MKIYRSNAVKQKTNDILKECVCNFLQPGVVSYQDVGAGIALLEKEAIEKMLPSFLGKPVIIDHQNGTADELVERGKAVGFVKEVYWNPETGWFDAKFTIEDEKALKKIEHGYSVSCAFNVKDVGKGGEWHAVKYDEEITDGEFVHLALVANPRYEDCEIEMLVNSKKAKINSAQKCPRCGSSNIAQGKTLDICKDCDANIQHEEYKRGVDYGPNSKQQSKEKPIMLNWFNKKKKNDEGEEIDISRAVVDVDGEKVPVSELIKYKKAEEAEEEEMEELSLEDEIEHEGGRHKIADMVDGFRKAKFGFDPKAKKVDDKKKKNGTTEKGDPIPEDADKVKKNDDEEKKKEDAKVIEDTPGEHPKQDKTASVTAEEKNLPKNNDSDKDIEKGTVINDDEEKKEDAKATDAEPSENPKTCDKCGSKLPEKKNESEEKKKEQAEEEEKEHSKEQDEEKKNDDEEKKETIKKEDSKKNVKWFKKLNSLREEGEKTKKEFSNSLISRIQRGKDRYGAKEQK